jgi:hypothetical protein
VRLPLERAIDAAEIAMTPLVRGVAWFDQGPFAGFFVEGDKAHVVRWASRIIRRLEKGAVSPCPYNLVLLAPRGGRSRLVIVPRRTDTTPLSFPGWGTIGVSAFGVAGRLLSQNRELPAAVAAELEPYVRSVILSPRDLPWLGELANDAGPDVVRRAA